MRTYEKIETIYNRDMNGTKKLVEGSWRNPTVEFLKDNTWVWTEKLDGTNIRVCWDGHNVSFGGRTERASIPAPLVNRLNEVFGGEQNAQLFEQLFGEREAILFGEGIGEKIQKAGSRYLKGAVDFVLFDLLVNGNYQPREFVESCANAFGIRAVPIVGMGTLEEAYSFVQAMHLSGVPASRIAEDPTLAMEGIVCRPAVELRDRVGNRLIVKIKQHDFD